MILASKSYPNFRERQKKGYIFLSTWLCRWGRERGQVLPRKGGSKELSQRDEEARNLIPGCFEKPVETLKYSTSAIWGGCTQTAVQSYVGLTQVTTPHWISKNLYCSFPVPEIHLFKHTNSSISYHIQGISVLYVAIIWKKITPRVVRNLLLVSTLYLFMIILEPLLLCHYYLSS